MLLENVLMLPSKNVLTYIRSAIIVGDWEFINQQNAIAYC